MEATQARGLWDVQAEENSIHDEECHYQQPRKRQPAKKSMGSAPSSTGTLGSLENRSGNNLQGLDSLSETQNFKRTWSENSPWGLSREVGNATSLTSAPPPTEMSSEPDSNVSLWPLFTTDADWQLDFDDQLTTLPTSAVKGATPIAVNDLDLSQSYNQPIQGSESSGLSRELIEYLTLSEKDRELGHISSSKRDEIVRIFKRLSTIKVPPSLMDLANEPCHDGFASWYRNNEALMESCKAGQTQEGSISISLMDSVMVFGYQAYLTFSQRPVNSEERNRALQYAKIPLRSRGSILRSPNTLLKFQTTISEQIDEIIHCELIAGAVSCARALKLDYRNLMYGSNMSNKDRDLARRSLWYLYSIEAPQCLRHGVSPVGAALQYLVLSHNWIDHAPPESGTEIDWFSVQCHYAIVISSAAEMLYTQQALRQSLIEREQKLKTAFELLEGWRKHLPTPLQEIHKQNTHLTLDDLYVRDITLSIFRQYHEAVYMICFPWVGNRSDGRVSKDCRRKCVDLCVNSAQVVLAIANQILNMEIIDSKFLDLIASSICIIFLDVATRSTAEKSFSYLSMGCGIFGRLTVLDNEVPFADVLELARTAQQIKGK
ncbi:hypothetical protein DH86_00004444 [Scytalidium sp. 3C]|nr:hypothetical protein DH86_00004444 [Scytalidium sp. 3C]